MNLSKLFASFHSRGVSHFLTEHFLKLLIFLIFTDAALWSTVEGSIATYLTCLTHKMKFFYFICQIYLNKQAHTQVTWVHLDYNNHWILKKVKRVHTNFFEFIFLTPRVTIKMITFVFCPKKCSDVSVIWFKGNNLKVLKPKENGHMGLYSYSYIILFTCLSRHQMLFEHVEHMLVEHCCESIYCTSGVR